LWAPHMLLKQSHNDLTQVHMSPGSIHPLPFLPLILSELVYLLFH
jgi:hypothetical protein